MWHTSGEGVKESEIYLSLIPAYILMNPNSISSLGKQKTGDLMKTTLGYCQ